MSNQVDASREIRLWVTQIILPIAVTCIVVVPEVREMIAEAVTTLRISIKEKRNKRESL